MKEQIHACIIVEKKQVVHRFVSFDENTDHFVKNIFPDWENDTFTVFDLVKDSEAIAIDLGAWIGTTAIWLSKNFHHVIAVDADKESLKCLQSNLIASECFNVSICDLAIAKADGEVLFGPIKNALNESMSCIKRHADKAEDYLVQSISLKQLIEKYVYANLSLKARKIVFIKCDIEGGEEEILEDLLQLAHVHNIKVHLSFHLDWWKNKEISRFAHLFALFKTNSPDPDVCAYITQNPLAALLFEPK